MPFTIEDKSKIIQYSLAHGIKATLEAVSLTDPISQSTLVRWRQAWRLSQERNYGAANLYDLTYKSRKPKHFRQSKVNGLILEYIQTQRLIHPLIGKDKLKPLIDEFCTQKNNSDNLRLKTISVSTTGRILASFKRQHIIPSYSSRVGIRAGELYLKRIRKKQVKQRRKDYQPESPGDLIQIDCITCIIKGERRYLICAIDIVSRYVFVYATDKLNSKATRDFIQAMIAVFPYQIKHIQTDNGSEFHKYFQAYLKKQNLIQFWNYPHSPKMNAYVERFNRTVQQEFVNFHLKELRNDLIGFNRLLQDYTYWYNTQRPHSGLQYLSPVQYLKQSY